MEKRFKVIYGGGDIAVPACETVIAEVAVLERRRFDDNPPRPVEIRGAGKCSTCKHSGVAGCDYEETYRIAFPMECGEFDIVETFSAQNDAEANRYAENEYPGQEWYVLRDNGENING